MSWLDNKTAEVIVASLAAGWLGGFWTLRLLNRRKKEALTLQESEILENARRQAETIVREGRLAGSEEAAKLREQIEKSFDLKRQEIATSENRLAQREGALTIQLEGLVEKEKRLRDEHSNLDQHRSKLEKERTELADLAKTRLEQLQKVAGLSAVEARQLLMKEVEQESARDAADLSRHIIEAAKSRAEEQAKRLISLAIQRHAGAHTFETTTATVALQGEDMKGRIIGRDGRNIRAFEAATGITVLIDDTPNAVVLSGFDPVRREIAREAMQRLILDGRIHPTRIEEIVEKVNQEMDESIVKAGEDAVYRLGLPPMHADVLKKLGALKFRHSFSQNILDHSIEVAQLMGIMASEIGLDIQAAKKSGLLHDIGKAMNHEVEGSHAIIGADFIKRCGETEDVVNAVASHHDEVPHTNPLGILVSAADAISASRPGARSESMSTYIKRLENLEQIGTSFPGVEKCFAIHAGRELRVVVLPDEVTDEQASLLARNIVRRVEDELQYPGQIRVTVVREKRCIEYAK
jgi:ribonuclease Y